VNKKKIILAAGGTGGHVFCATNLGSYLQLIDYDVYLVTDSRGHAILEKTKNSFPNFKILISFLWRKSTSVWMPIVYPLSLIASLVQSIFYLLYHRPYMVIGFGGYPSVPTVLAAQLLNIPTIIHEQNAILGKANKILAKKAKTIALSFEQTVGIDEAYKAKTLISGNPVSAQTITYTHQPFILPSSAHEPFIILITGGSQGSQALSQDIATAIVWAQQNTQHKMIIYHQCPAHMQSLVQDIYKNHSIEATIEPFFENISMLMAISHLIISRSGASTIAQLMMIKRPAILIPLKLRQKESDQYYNALFMKNAGCAMVIDQDCLKDKKFAKILCDLIKNKSDLIAMQKAYDHLAFNGANANQILARQIEQIK
jgi:UDP-N-acetylglucosamine--N-acetylmuramyl-(pentapeptide) pyrophosphoryl-undecaprenol N-acetylglucosamine transferase